MYESFLGYKPVGGLIFPDVHTSLKTKIPGDACAYNDDDKGQVHQQDIDLALPVKLAGEYHPGKIDDHQQHQDLKPPGIIDQKFGCGGTEIIFNKCGISDRNSKNDHQDTHKSPGKKKFKKLHVIRDFKATPDKTHQIQEGQEMYYVNQLQTYSQKIIENMLIVSFCCPGEKLL
jgi:hypothetical protein